MKVRSGGGRDGNCEKENGCVLELGTRQEVSVLLHLYAISAHLSGEAHEVAKNEIIGAVLALSAHDNAVLLHDEVNVVTY